MRFEKLTTPLRVRLLQVLGYIAASIVTGILIFAITFRYIDSPKEKLLRQQNDDLKQNYKVMEERIKQLQLQMDEIANRDNYVYRSIFESNPILRNRHRLCWQHRELSTGHVEAPEFRRERDARPDRR